jgi:hypothetical protein
MATRRITCELWIWHSVYWEYSPGGTTVSRFAILQHINFTFDSSVRRLLRSPLNWFLLSTDFTLHCSCFTMQLLLAYSLPRNLVVKAYVSVLTTYYIRVSDTAVVTVFISAETETSSHFRRCLVMDFRVDSYNQPLSSTPHYMCAISLLYFCVNKRYKIDLEKL